MIPCYSKNAGWVKAGGNQRPVQLWSSWAFKTLPAQSTHLPLCLPCLHPYYAFFIVNPARGYGFNRLLITARNYHKMHNASSGILDNKSAHNNYAEASADYYI
jgi:hypothetical protein